MLNHMLTGVHYCNMGQHRIEFALYQDSQLQRRKASLKAEVNTVQFYPLYAVYLHHYRRDCLANRKLAEGVIKNFSLTPAYK